MACFMIELQARYWSLVRWKVQRIFLHSWTNCAFLGHGRHRSTTGNQEEAKLQELCLVHGKHRFWCFGQISRVAGQRSLGRGRWLPLDSLNEFAWATGRWRWLLWETLAPLHSLPWRLPWRVNQPWMKWKRNVCSSEWVRWKDRRISIENGDIETRLTWRIISLTCNSYGMWPIASAWTRWVTARPVWWACPTVTASVTIR